MRCSVFIVSLLFNIVLFFAGVVNAQDLASGAEGSFVVRLTPEFPHPLESVTAEVVSNSFNVDAAPITWILDGKTKLGGVGKRNFTFTTGEVGSVVSLQAEVDTPDFGIVSKELNIRPSDVDILWEADTYTPPFYKGKALPTSQSYIKVLGIPSFVDRGGKIASDDLIYKWKKTYTPNPSDSGVGKNIYQYRGTYTLNTDTIETIVSSRDGLISMSKKTKISISEPKIVFYESKPLEGVRYENSLGGNFDIKETELTLRAEPYFFSFSNANNNGANFSWELDGKSLEINPDKKAEFTLRKPESGSGRANISLKIENTGYDLQTMSKNIGISYTN